MNCTECGGICCSTFDIPLTLEDIDRIASYMNKSSFEILTCHTTHGYLIKKSGFCSFLKKGKCSIHVAKPEACREFECTPERHIKIQATYNKQRLVA